MDEKRPLLEAELKPDNCSKHARDYCLLLEPSIGTSAYSQILPKLTSIAAIQETHREFQKTQDENWKRIKAELPLECKNDPLK